ncbi:hypothetical protein DL764_002807 [Monosporascus ibericus]|uniref:Uncharacterized protein n=1 Tax=Monosporascus ibericus TaxID=155417 RepID=A0A4Q4TLH4_9PEZI|nr:hypothetical protein DL764_002807 [Monosporascus ibericus]
MAVEESASDIYEGKEHQAAYIFDPVDEATGESRPSKRRKVSKKHGRPETHDLTAGPVFQPLFEGVENEECVRLRQRLFEDSWSEIDRRIQSTLEEVTSFIRASSDHAPDGKVPSAFIITGPNIASQELLFEQLSETLQTRAKTKAVRLRSGDASNLRALLKKIIHDATARATEEDTDLEVAMGKDGRKYLNYDLEALHAHLKSNPRHHVVIAFQDSEAFDSGLLSDLISLLGSWLDRIPFALLFGVATSVELFQARLLKSTCQCLYGDQFDVEQSASIVDKIFKTAIVHPDAPLRLEELRGKAIQPEHVEALRSLPSFHRSVETSIEKGDVKRARLLLEDDDYVVSHLQGCLRDSRRWVERLLRILKYFNAGKALSSDFTQLYLDAIANGADFDGEYATFVETVKQMLPSDAATFLTHVLDAIKEGDRALGLDQWADDNEETVDLLSGILADIEDLRTKAEDEDHVLRSKYSGQSKVLRTTVIAQKVQLSRDTAALTDQDKTYTSLIDRLAEHLQAILSCEKAESLPFNEVWLYDSKAPYRDVFVPRPRVIIERALSRPHDYLGCSCCKTEGDHIASTLPATAILYRLYLETESLINVADLWSAYLAIVGEESENGLDERTALVLFYRGLAELRAMGFVKQSRKKADHIAKLAWKGL